MQCGHDGGGQNGGIGVAGELAGGLHYGQAIAQLGFPAVKAIGDCLTGFGVLLGELPGQRSDWTAATALALALVLDKRVEPAVKTFPGIEAVKQLALGVQDFVAGRGDGGAYQRILIGEVVVELASAGGGVLPDVVKADGGDPTIGDQLRGGADDPFAGGASSHGDGGGRRHCR